MSEIMIEVIERACTFELMKWFYRPQPIFNPYRLAANGYSCTDLNTIDCDICHNTVLFTDENGEEKDFQTLSKQVSNHDKYCIYRQNPHSNLHAQENNEENHKPFHPKQLYLQMDSLIEKTKNSWKKVPNNFTYPLINLNRFWKEVESHDKKDLLEIILEKYEIKKNQPRISFFLTLMGWKAINLREIGCSFCGRRVSIAEEQYDKTHEDKQKYSDQSNSEQKLFDMFDSHRYFCLWAHGPEGWDLFIQNLWDKLGQFEQLFKKQKPEEIKKIRVLFDKYLQNFKSQTSEQFDKITTILKDCQTLAQSLQNEGQDLSEIKEKMLERRMDLKDYLETIQGGIRGPLKKMKI